MKATTIFYAGIVIGLNACGGGGQSADTTSTSKVQTLPLGQTATTSSPDAVVQAQIAAPVKPTNTISSPSPIDTQLPIDTPLPINSQLKTPPIGAQLNDASCVYQYSYQNLPTTLGVDPEQPKQWHLQNTGQTQKASPTVIGEDLRVTQAWLQTKGEGARVAVLDDAVEIIHADLAPNAIVGASFNYRLIAPYATFPLPCFTDDNHGTAVTGVIIARDNNAVGGAGVAPRAQLVAYNALSTGTDADVADALTRDLKNNDIVHNSWGSSDDGKLHAADALFIAAINKGIETGRSGKGTIFVFPAGNGGCYLTSGTPQRCSDDNSNFDGYVTRLGQITVGTVGPDGKRIYFSEPGANILVSAPGINITTTTVGNKSRDDFGGSSASAPMVSGIVALMLSANPQLTWRDVQLILAKSARKNHAPDLGWVAGNGYNFNHYYGFGVPDANLAVSLAKSWVSVGNSSSLKSCGPFSQSVNAALPDAPAVNRVISSTVAVDATCAITKIEFIEVVFNAQHTYSGDLQVTLESPQGLQSLLAQRRSCSSDQGDTCRPFSSWQFGSVRHLDEPTLGQWKLKVSDEAPVDTGVWKDWSIKFYGR